MRVVRRSDPLVLGPHRREINPAEREFFIGNLLVRLHFIIVMIRWTGLAPWEFELPLRFAEALGVSVGRRAVAMQLLRQQLHRNVLWYRGGLVFEAYRFLHHSA